MASLPKFVVKDSNNVAIFDKEAIAAAGIKDFQFDAETTAALVTFYDAVIEATNAGDKSIRMSCEVSDVAAKAKCIAEMQ